MSAELPSNASASGWLPRFLRSCQQASQTCRWYRKADFGALAHLGTEFWRSRGRAGIQHEKVLRLQYEVKAVIAQDFERRVEVLSDEALRAFEDGDQAGVSRARRQLTLVAVSCSVASCRRCGVRI